jgi:hypothetical protein
MNLRAVIGVFLLAGAIAGVVSSLGLIFIDKGIFILDEKLVAITPAVAISAGLIAAAYFAKAPLGAIRSIWVLLSVYLSWYLAVTAAVSASNHAVFPIAFMTGGIVGGGLLSILLSAAFPALRRLWPIAGIAVVGAIGAIPFVIADKVGIDDNAGYFVLFVIWQALVLAAIGYYVRTPTDSSMQKAA